MVPCRRWPTPGLEVPDEYDVDGEYTVRGGASAMAELLSLPTPPTAVFAQSDEMAAGAMQAMTRMGVQGAGGHQHCRLR